MLRIIILIRLAAATRFGCRPFLVGAGGAVIADKALEDQQGGDGLFQAPAVRPVRRSAAPARRRHPLPSLFHAPRSRPWSGRP